MKSLWQHFVSLRRVCTNLTTRTTTTHISRSFSRNWIILFFPFHKRKIERERENKRWKKVMHPLPIPHLFVMRATLDYHPHLSTIFRTLSYVGNVQLVRRSFRLSLSLCFYEGRTADREPWASLTTTISFFFFFFWGSLSVCLCGGCCIVQFPSLRHSTNSLLVVVHRETIFKEGWKPDGTDIEKREESLYNIYLDIINFTLWLTDFPWMEQ